MRMPAPLSKKKRIQNERNTTDDPKDGASRNECVANVIDCHTYEGDDLELVSAQEAETITMVT